MPPSTAQVRPPRPVGGCTRAGSGSTRKTSRAAAPAKISEVVEADSLALIELVEAEMEITGRLVEASNATFLTEVRTPSGSTTSWVYKPTEGERPLWDFPHGTLGLREVAAYEVSRTGGFDCVPVTVFAEGPLGPGSLQAWVESEPDGCSAACRSGPAHRWCP